MPFHLHDEDCAVRPLSSAPPPAADAPAGTLHAPPYMLAQIERRRASLLAARERRTRALDMALTPKDPGYRFALMSSCVFFMVCSAGMLVFHTLVLRRVGLPITVSVPIKSARGGGGGGDGGGGGGGGGSLYGGVG